MPFAFFRCACDRFVLWLCETKTGGEAKSTAAFGRHPVEALP